MTHVLPTGWEEKTLCEVCEIISGTTPDTKNPKYWDGNNYWITPAELTEDKIFINDCRRKITDLAVQHCSLRPMPRGTVIFSSRAPIGKLAINNIHTLYCNQGFKNFVCSKAIHNKFLYYFLKLNTPLLISLGKGTTFKEISKSTVSKVRICFPAIPEQKRIVEKLDKIFADIDKAKENTQKNLTNAKEIFYSSLNNIFTGKMNGWKEKTLGGLCETITKGTTPTTNGYHFVQNGINFVKIETIDINGNFIKNKFSFISEECHNSQARSKLQEGDILYSIAGALGRSSIVTKDILPANTNQALAIIRLKKDAQVIPQFIHVVLRTNAALQQIEKYKGGVAQQNLSLKQISDFRIFVPSLSEQKRIVEKSNTLSAKTQELEQIYTKKLADLDELKQSVLQQAFSGKL